MKTVKDIEEASRQVLMAGLGICGLGKDYAVHKLDVLMEDFNGFVNSLLLKGEQVEEDLHINERVQAIKDRRISRIRKKLGFNNDPQLNELDQLSQKLDMLTKVVDKLAEQKAQKPQSEQEAAQTKAVPKEAVQKAEVKTVTPAKKPVARKATAAKATESKTSATKSTTAKSTTSTAAAKTTTRRKSTNASQTDTGADS
ncbi:hypothetical protein KIH87_14705 [Paraneptunicella aestuarii]|uniref:hypothetical protein n=1 Tax=Paraneptunicella aestuarii TaxID=2831148 RepID=UPI001E589F35|nr:hypothetical protein [Paraneptunicella aestuarii]UAA37932.1 hypothetical protein KIH87_14705 [Paraneptunicella aestuarii]